MNVKWHEENFPTNLFSTIHINPHEWINFPMNNGQPWINWSNYQHEDNNALPLFTSSDRFWNSTLQLLIFFFLGLLKVEATRICLKIFIDSPWWAQVHWIVEKPFEISSKCVRTICIEKWTKCSVQNPQSPSNGCALVFRLEIEFQFSSFYDWSIVVSIGCEWIYCFIVWCVCAIQIRFCIHISSHNVVRKSNEMCCNFEIQYVTETHTSNTAPCTNASIRLFRIQLLCCLPANECVYWMGRGWTEKLCSHTHAHNLICNAPPIVVVILLRIFAILINWCDMSQSHIHLHCTISSLHRMQREKESEIGFNSLTMSSNKRPGRKTSMFL